VAGVRSSLTIDNGLNLNVEMWLLAIALVGLFSSTVFLTMLAIAAVRYRREHEPIPSRVDVWPQVSLLKPLCGLEPNLEANLESFFRQDYPAFEIVFGTRDATDPALDTVRSLQKRYPEVPVQIVCSGTPQWPSAKICSLEKMYGIAISDYVVISDSDVHVEPHYVREVVKPLLNPAVGLVTCLYRGVPSGGPWSLLEALGMSVEMTSGVIVANMMEGMRFALGPTMATRRELLDAIGGFASLADYCADDYVLGEKVHGLGKTVVLSHHVIDHIVVSRAFRASMLHQVRWMKSTRFSRRLGHIGSGLTFAIPFGLIGLLWGLVTHHLAIGVLLLAASILNRMLLALISGWMVVRDKLSLRYCCLYPVRDLMGFGFWCASFFGSTIVWRGQRYRLVAGGKMIKDGPPPKPPSPSGTVAVDDLA
jgi:ceramide glucosyltransferase